jgi:UDPglucose 6-dehydrogenase
MTKLISSFKVEHNQIYRDLSITEGSKDVKICSDAYEAAVGSHAIIILTEWDEFASADYEEIYKVMEKPAYIFDGRRILSHEELAKIGFHVKVIGKIVSK